MKSGRAFAVASIRRRNGESRNRCGHRPKAEHIWRILIVERKHGSRVEQAGNRKIELGIITEMCARMYRTPPSAVWVLGAKSRSASQNRTKTLMPPAPTRCDNISGADPATGCSGRMQREISKTGNRPANKVGANVNK